MKTENAGSVRCQRPLTDNEAHTIIGRTGPLELTIGPLPPLPPGGAGNGLFPGDPDPDPAPASLPLGGVENTRGATDDVGAATAGAAAARGGIDAA
jgi:hypothetical protein